LRCPQKWCCPCQRLTSTGKVYESLVDLQQSLSKLAERRRMTIEPLQIWLIKWKRRRLWVFVSLDYRMLCNNIDIARNVQKEESMLLMQYDAGRSTHVFLLWPWHSIKIVLSLVLRRCQIFHFLLSWQLQHW